MQPSPVEVAELPDVRIAYREQGSGPAVVLLHGGALDHRMWRRQLDPPVQNHRVIAVDARGHGASSTPTGPFRHCDDVAALLHRLDAGPAVLVGLSMGGATAVDTALEYPDLVRGLVISGVGTGEPDFRDPWMLRMLGEWAAAGEARDTAEWTAVFLRIGAGPHRTLADLDPTVLDELREMAEHTLATHLRPDSDTGVVTPPQPTAVPDTWARLADLDVPLLAVLGGVDSDDHIRMAERAAALVRHGRTVTVGGTGHYPNMERPDAFDAHVRAFLTELDGH